MGQEYRVLTANQGDGTDSHGNVSYWVKLDVDGEPEPVSALLVQKPETPAPNGTLFGRLESQTSKKGNEYFRFRKEQREDGSPQAQYNGNGAGAQSSKPDAEFWAQKDKRLARAGMTQAVVSSGAIAAPKSSGELSKYVSSVALTVDALLEDLEKRAPSPNTSSAMGPSPSAGTGTAQATPNMASPGVQASESQGSGPDFTSQDFAAALAACGHNITGGPEATYIALNPDQKAAVKTIYTNLASQGANGDPKGGPVIPEPVPSGFSDDSEIPF